MNDYTKGILTGASLILCFFMFVSAKSQGENLGDIVVNSVSVVDEDGDLVGSLGSLEKAGFLLLTSVGGEPSLQLTANSISSYNADGKRTALLGTGTNGEGMLTTANRDGKTTVIIGTDKGEGGLQRGLLQTWDTDGKKVAFLSSQLITYNKHEVMVGYFGMDQDNDGVAVLYDRYGDGGWSASGKQ